MPETTLSGPHRRMSAALELRGIEHRNEVPDFRPYLLDIYLPEWHLCVEVDGRWHKPKRDAARDTALSQLYGIETFRVSAERVRSVASALLLIPAITEFIEQHAHTAKERKLKWRISRY